MIELPEAVAAADALAAEADFFSIGSNDLSATVLGLDRRHPALTPARAAAPPVLRAIATATDAARRAGIEVSVCGDAAADPEVLPLLIGVGVTALSVAPAALDEVRARVRELRLTACQAAAQGVMRE
jgi:phosphoenolpyruvate-protein kinase (PTS system EI component)